MFHYLNGTLAYCALNTAVIDCGGVGYKLTVSSATIGKIAGKENTTVKLFTYMAVREDAVELYGFHNEEELDTYKLLIGVSGIGPKAAISILSVLTPNKLAEAVTSGDTKMIARAQGIGAKTAARVVLELKDKLSKAMFDAEGPLEASEMLPAQNNLADAQSVLSVLGYTQGEISSALREIDATLDSEAIIRLALKKLSKN